MPRQAMDFASTGSSIGKQIMDAGNAQESAKTNMGLLLAKQFQAQSAADKNNAQADYFKTKGDLDRQRAQYQTPEFASTVGAETAGISSSLAKEFDAFKEKGNWGMGNAMPNEALQMTMAPQPKTAPQGYSPEVLNRYNAGRAAHVLGLGSTGDSNVDQTTKAITALLERGDYDASKASPESLLKYGQAQYAQKGGAPFSQDGTGVLNVLSGSSVAKPEWQAVQKSIAAENAAQAGNASASAALHRAQIPEVQSRIKLNESKIGADSVVINPDGTQTIIKGSGKPGKAPTEFQGKAALYGARAKEAHDLMDNLDGMKGVDAYSRLAVTSLGGNGVLNTLANPAMSKSTQKVIQAQRDFLNAVLRQESGAVIGPTEFENGKKQYFPQLGDTDDVIKQKRRNRETAIMGFDNIAGSAAYEAPPIDDGGGNPPAAQPTAAAIAHLVKNPNLAPAFAAKYGKDATDRALGKVR